MSDTLTLDALVEDVRNAIGARLRVNVLIVAPSETHEWINALRDALAQDALAAVAQAAGGRDPLRYGATCIDETDNHSEQGQRAADDCAALLRALADAAHDAR